MFGWTLSDLKKGLKDRSNLEQGEHQATRVSEWRVGTVADVAPWRGHALVVSLDRLAIGALSLPDLELAAVVPVPTPQGHQQRGSDAPIVWLSAIEVIGDNAFAIMSIGDDLVVSRVGLTDGNGNVRTYANVPGTDFAEACVHDAQLYVVTLKDVVRLDPNTLDVLATRSLDGPVQGIACTPQGPVVGEYAAPRLHDLHPDTLETRDTVMWDGRGTRAVAELDGTLYVADGNGRGLACSRDSCRPLPIEGDDLRGLTSVAGRYIAFLDYTGVLGLYQPDTDELLGFMEAPRFPEGPWTLQP